MVYRPPLIIFLTKNWRSLRSATGYPDTKLRFAHCFLQCKVGDYCKKNKKNRSNLPLLVGMSGLEPPTPTLSGWCSNQLSYIPLYKQNIFGITIAILVQREICNFIKGIMVEIIGFEPMTPCLQGRCSSQLSYTPIYQFGCGGRI